MLEAVVVVSSSCLTIGSSLGDDDDDDDDDDDEDETEKVEMEVVEACRPVSLPGDSVEAPVGCVVVEISKLISPGYERSLAAVR